MTERDLRFIEREGKKVLQQYILELVHSSPYGLERRGFWEDVPFVAVTTIDREQETDK